MKVPRPTTGRLMLVVAVTALLVALERRWEQGRSRRELDEPLTCVEDARTTLAPIRPTLYETD